MLVAQTNATSDPETMALVERAAAVLTAGGAEDAERLARLAIGRDSAYVPARLALGRALEAQNRHAEAATVYADVARISPLSSGVSRSIRRVWLAPLAGFGIVATVLWAVFRVVGRHFDQRTVLYGLVASTAVLVGGALIATWRHRRRFATMSASDRELMQAYSAGGIFVGPAPGRLFSIALVIIALSAAAIVFAVGTKPSLAMHVGDCFTMTERTTVEQISAIPCDLPHVTEVYAIFTDPAPSDGPFPGLDTIRATALPTCLAAYESFIGAPYTTASRLAINILSPERPYWDAGVRSSWCAVEDPEGTQVTGSAKGRRE